MAIGFIGLGAMGAGMCYNLATKSGVPVLACDHDPAKLAARAADGVVARDTAAALAAGAKIVFLCLPTIDHVETACFGADGLATGDVRPRIVVDCGTSPPAATRALAVRLADAGVAFADAPVARMREAAWAGTLSILVGAPGDVFAEIRPLLACMASDITHCGDVGAGQTAKVLNNMVLFQSVHALALALAIGRASGLDGETLFRTLELGPAESKALHLQGKRHLLTGDFPEGAFSTLYAAKDVRLAAEMAATAGLDTALLDATLAALSRTAEGGHADAYYPALVEHLARA